MAPTVHSAQGASTAYFLYLLLVFLGLTQEQSIALTFLLAIPCCWMAHWLIDMIKHFEFIHCGTFKQFLEDMLGDPKKWIKKKGPKPVLSKKGREELGNELAYPTVLKINDTAMFWGYVDVALAILEAVGIAILFWVVTKNWWLAAMVIWGSCWCIAPDLALHRFFYDRLSKHRVYWINHCYWALDYLHHLIHCTPLDYKWRWWGLVIQIVSMLFFIWLALPWTWPFLLFH